MFLRGDLGMGSLKFGVWGCPPALWISRAPPVARAPQLQHHAMMGRSGEAMGYGLRRAMVAMSHGAPLLWCSVTGWGGWFVAAWMMIVGPHHGRG